MCNMAIRRSCRAVSGCNGLFTAASAASLWGAVGTKEDETRPAAVKLGGRRRFFVRGETTFPRGSHEVCQRESTRRVKRAGIVRWEIKMPDVCKVKNRKKFCGMQDAVSCM